MDTLLNLGGELTVIQLIFYRKFRHLEAVVWCKGSPILQERYARCLLHDLSEEEEAALLAECRQPAAGGQVVECPSCWCWTKAPEEVFDLAYSLERILEMAAQLTDLHCGSAA